MIVMGIAHSCMKRNVFDIDEAQEKEFVISVEPLLLVILKDDVEEFKIHLKEKVVSLIFDEHCEDTGMLIVNEQKDFFFSTGTMFDVLGMMNMLQYLRIVRVDQNWVLNNRNKTLMVMMFQSFHKLRLEERFVLQFDAACECEIIHPTECLAS